MIKLELFKDENKPFKIVVDLDDVNNKVQDEASAVSEINYYFSDEQPK